MGRLRAFDIVFEGNGLALADGVPVYRAGSVLSGMVQLALSAPRDDVRGTVLATYHHKVVALSTEMKV